MSPTLRAPVRADAPALHDLVAGTGVLDVNSPYAYVLVCEHFRRTSVVAELDGAIVGFVSGYRLPDQPDTLFVWQVGVSEAARGHGLATRMVLHLVQRPGITHLLTTVTPDNVASTRLFARIAERVGAPLTHPDAFAAELLGPAGAHLPEKHFSIGPIPQGTHEAL